MKVDPVFRDGTPPDVEIRVASKMIQGEIVDLRNVRVPVASLSVSGFPEPMNVEGGWFTWDKVVDGWMTVHATARGLNGFDSSPFRKIHVSGGWVDPGFLSLEIRPTYVLHGRAVLPSGEPAAGARIRIVSSPFYEIRTTPADGRFQMTIRGGGENACLLVVDSSKAARLVPVPASETEQDVPVAVAPGTLSLEFTPRGERRIGTLVANGCKLSWVQFSRTPADRLRLHGHGDEVDVPGVRGGVCDLRARAVGLRRGRRDPARRVRVGNARAGRNPRPATQSLSAQIARRVRYPRRLMALSDVRLSAQAAFVARRLLAEKMVKASSVADVRHALEAALLEDRDRERALDEEVKRILEKNAATIRGANVDYAEMFRKAKRMLAEKKKIPL